MPIAPAVIGTKGSDGRQEARKKNSRLPIFLKENLTLVNENLMFIQRPKLTNPTWMAIPQPKCQAVSQSRPTDHRAKNDNKIEITGCNQSAKAENDCRTWNERAEDGDCFEKCSKEKRPISQVRMF